MNAICEQCQASYHVQLTRGRRLKEMSCPKGHPGLIAATWIGLRDGVSLYQARTRPELQCIAKPWRPFAEKEASI
jgi:uncharacterized protein (DUF1684 family)